MNMSKETPEGKNFNFNYPNIIVRTWHGIPIELGKDQDHIWIKTNNLPMVLEVLVWNIPLTILLALTLLISYLLGGRVLLLISFFIFFLVCIISGFFSLKHNLDFHWGDMLTKIHLRFGTQEIIRFSIPSSPDRLNVQPLDNRSFFVEDILAIGYSEDLDGFMCQIYIIMKNGVVIPVGGSYGNFRTGNQNQRKEFERLYLNLGSFFHIPLQIKIISDTFETKNALKESKYVFSSTILIKSCFYLSSYQYYLNSNRTEKLNLHPLFEKIPISLLSVYMIIPGISLFICVITGLFGLEMSLNLQQLADNLKITNPLSIILLAIAVVISVFSIFIILLGIIALFRGSYDFIAYEYWDLSNNGVEKYINFIQYSQDLIQLEL